MKILESKNMELVGHVDFDGKGDGMQIMRKGDYLFMGHMGYNYIGDEVLGTSVIDISDPTKPRVVKQIMVPKNTHSHKVQLSGDILLVNHEQQIRAGEGYSAGLAVYDVSKPADPKQIGFMPIKGKGVHRMWWAGDKYAYFSAREEGYDGRFMMTADVSDPEHPRIHSRWWYPGQHIAGGEKPQWEAGPTLRAHHIIPHGNRGYGGYGDGGLFVFEINDGHLKLISETSWGHEVGPKTHTHTGLPLPGKNLVVVTDESLADNCQESKKLARVFDISDEKKPVQIGILPEPDGDFCERGGRFGPHNLHENRPEAESFRSEDILFLTYFNAGLRVYDISDRSNFKEIGVFLPEAPAGQKAVQINDIFASSDGLIFASDRLSGGIYILRMTNGVM